MNNNIQPAYEFFRDCMEGGQSVYTDNQRKFIKKAIEFAILHAENALESASNIEIDSGKGETEFVINHILNSYPKEKIK